MRGDATDVGRAPAEPGSHPSEQAPTGLGSASFDPSRSFRLGAFATGNYWGTCRACGFQFIGDKRAMKCLACSVDDANALLESRYKEIARLKDIQVSADILLDHRSPDGSIANTLAAREVIAMLASAIEARRAAASDAVADESAAPQGATPNSSHTGGTHGR
jgi:hypothetical protein